MRLRTGQRGTVIIAVLAVMLGLMLVLMLGGDGYRAEAVLGGVGNITDTNNPHNLSNSSSGIKAVSESQICIFCHTPHRAITDSALINAPLWNHTLSTQTYKVKSPGTLYNQTAFPTIIMNLLSQPLQSPDGASKLCLSCHDGTVSLGDVSNGGPIDINDIINACVSTSDKLITGASCNAYVGNDLTTKHVVSVPMNDGLIAASQANCSVPGQTYRLQYPWDGGQENTVLLRPTSSLYPTGGSPGVTRNTRKYKSGYNYGVQCSSCHDPHLWTSTTDTQVPGYKFLVLGFNSLCGACHVSCT